ncbi:RNA polymerase sigma factor [Hoyosella sp. G463]|uniref:RNA polymerase sigma factor n=1 Tax=Lolliginicoccus lacisalsi TaxID=2742202 RepID=A0A927JAL2_9ACTN|nr:RNA polymerase sigma factor [Lolliginicoccus lacisalsi]MBD8505603.1 RNA polymerase sigma factor [Lolliginicoccus lacisalsi]
MSTRSRDAPPFESVVEQHGPMVLRVCRALLGPSPDADDAWSETFLSALRAYPALPAGANTEAWLVTIAHRKAIDVVRARQRRPVPVPDVPEPPRHDAPEAAGTGIWQQVAALPPRQRQVIAYRYLAGLPYSDIAAITGGTAAAARRAAADGIAALRRTLSTSEESR